MIPLQAGNAQLLSELLNLSNINNLSKNKNLNNMEIKDNSGSIPGVS